MKRRSFAPVWLMGLTGSVLGMFFGVLVVAIPEVLSARHVPEATIASITAVAVSPAFWSFLVSPVLDVRFTRRWYLSMAQGLSFRPSTKPCSSSSFQR